MRKIKGLKPFGVALAAAMVALAVLPGALAADTNYPLTLTDDLGREVTIESKTERIVSLAPSNTEMLFYLGLDDEIVGVTDYCDYPSATAGKTTIGGPWSPSIEDIVALEPDLVLAAGVNPEDVVTGLSDLGITVFGIDANDMDDLLDDIETIGRITDKQEIAEELTESMQEKVDKVTDATDDLSTSQKPDVFYIVWHDPIYTVGDGEFCHDIIEMAGGVNVFDDLEGWKSVNLEDVIERNPDVIIVTAMGGQGSGTWDWVTTDETLAGVAARQNDRVYYIESNWLERPGPRIVLGLLEMVDCLHPDIFEDDDDDEDEEEDEEDEEEEEEEEYEIEGSIFGKDFDCDISQDGQIGSKVEASSTDGGVQIIIAKDTIAQDRAGERLDNLKIDEYHTPPPPPRNTNIIGLAYKFRPSGATFDSAITLTFNYDPANLPPDTDEANLVLAYYDDDENRWVELDCTVDTENNTITAMVEHFTTFAIIGEEASATPVTTPPQSADTGSTTTSSQGTDAGTTPTTPITAEEGQPQPPAPPQAAPAPINWLMIGGIIGGVSAGIAIPFAIKRRRED